MTHVAPVAHIFVEDVPQQDSQDDQDPIVNAIRENALVQVHWSELTDAERHAAYVVLFDI